MDKKTPAPVAKKHTKVQRRVFLLCTISIVAALAFVCVRNVANGYFDTFVRHGVGSNEAMSVNPGLAFTTAEQTERQPLQLAWDAYANSRLCDTVTTTTRDGTPLSAGLYNEGSTVTVIALHGFNGTGSDPFLYAPYFAGYNLLLPDARSHGKSGGDVFGWGYLEQHDLAQWLSWIAEHLGDQQVIIYGMDTGANTALFAAGNGLLTENVACIIAESPYDTLANLSTYTLSESYKIPPFLHFANLLDFMAGVQKVGYRLSDVEVTAAVSTAKVPALFLWSSEDDYIPPAMTQAVYAAYSGEKTEVGLPARHGYLYPKHQDEVEQALDALLTTTLNK